MESLRTARILMESNDEVYYLLKISEDLIDLMETYKKSFPEIEDVIDTYLKRSMEIIRDRKSIKEIKKFMTKRIYKKCFLINGRHYTDP